MKDFYSHYILNPATKQHFILPPYSGRIVRKGTSCVTYAAASMAYKVVLAYCPVESSNIVNQLAILTVGVDNSWRHICTEHLSPTAKELFWYCPLITEGFVHWAKNSNQVLTLNVETEIITETAVPLPQLYGEEKEKFYMSTGRYLSLLIARGQFFWEVWEMKPETEEWTKLPNIELEAQKCRFEQFGYKHDQTLLPVGWLNYPEVLVFRISRTTSTNSLRAPSEDYSCIFYNLHTHEIDSIILTTLTINCFFTVRRNSLVWLTGS